MGKTAKRLTNTRYVLDIQYNYYKLTTQHPKTINTYGRLHGGRVNLAVRVTLATGLP